ncbi:aldo/keto reductase [Nitrosomonas sp. Nm34]|uniref:aldo/keto reductase n=1 Tax=Nitrosomonas sp. Nm34 TaxID=1881055 RepID=UPI0008E2574C|nr:aldo/keto reductase [Nitrosomonas sp. Nm34]SFI58000.1 Predicted oxidoreductase of the aldo/keto reductase family [Nitrosomonas sp. Nm34]
MRYRRLGRTNLKVSEVGFGTCQLRMVPVHQAIETLVTGFNMGVNIVHTAPDYGDAPELIAEAIRVSGRHVYVCSNGWGSTSYFEQLFEDTISKFGHKGSNGKVQLDFFGIASVEDREILHEDVWGSQGLVAFLQRKKREGVLLHTFCTSHGSPDYIHGLIKSDVFDAVMFAYNPLGYHMLSFTPPDDRGREAVDANLALFELAHARDVGVMLMEVLAGGLLCRSRAFPARIPLQTGNAQATPTHASLPAVSELLRYILRRAPTVACVMPGTASVEEALENASAGHGVLGGSVGLESVVSAVVDQLQNSVCSRCGQCEPLCSRQLPISWLFRASDIERTGAVSFETPQQRQYFDIHPVTEGAVCSACDNHSCRCPQGIDIPGQLVQRHGQMMQMFRTGVVPGPMVASDTQPSKYAGRWISGTCSSPNAVIVIQNIGTHGWHLAEDRPSVHLLMHRADDDKVVGRLRLRAEVPSGGIAYFPLEQSREDGAALARLSLALLDKEGKTMEDIELEQLSVARIDDHQPTPELARAHAVRYGDHSLPSHFIPGQRCRAWVDVRNEGTQRWEPHPPDGQAVNLVLRVEQVTHQFPLPHPVAPQETARVQMVFLWPSTSDPVVLTVDMVKQNVTYFSNARSAPLQLTSKAVANLPTKEG